MTSIIVTVTVIFIISGSHALNFQLFQLNFLLTFTDPPEELLIIVAWWRMRILWWGSQAPISLIHQFLLAPVKDDIWYKYIIYDILFLPPPIKDDIYIIWYLHGTWWMHHICIFNRKYKIVKMLWLFMYGVCAGVLEIKQNEMCGAGSILIYAPQSGPHIGPIHSHYTPPDWNTHTRGGLLIISSYPES